MSASGGGGSVGGLWLQLRASTGSFERDMARAERRTKRTEGTLNEADATTRRLQGAFTVAAAGAVGLAYGLSQLVSAGTETEQQLSVIQATSGATEKEMASLRSEIQQTTKELPVGLRDTAAAAKELSFAGQDADDMMGTLAPTAELAASSQMSVADSARFSASMMNQFGLEADQTASVADAAAGTFANSAVTLKEVGNAAEYAGTSFAAAGQDVATLNSFIGLLGDAGIRGSRAGTSLRQSVNKLSSPTGEAKKRLDELGISADDLTDKNGDMKDMVSIFEQIGGGLEGMDQKEQIAAMADIFGQRAAPAALKLANAAESGEAEAKRLAIRASQLGGALEGLSDLDNSAIKERNAELSKMADEEGIAQSATLTLNSDMSQMDALKQLRAKSDQLSGEQLTQQISTGFGLEEETAQQLTFEIQNDTDLGKLNKRLDEAQTTGGLTAAKMDTLGGKLKYIQGSIQGITFNMFKGVAPLLTPIVEVGMTLTDVLSEHENLTKALGAGLGILTGAAIAAAAGIGLMYANLAISRTITASAKNETLAYRGAMLASSAASKTAAGAKAVYTAALNGNLLALGRAKAAQVAETASNYASAAAQKVNTAARYAGRAAAIALAGATAGATAARSAYTTVTQAATGATLAEKAATLGSTAAKWAAQRAGMAYAGAEAVVTAARESSTIAAISERAAQAGLTAARYAGKGAALAGAAGSATLTAARKSSIATAIASRSAQAGLTAARYAGRAAAFAAAGGTWALNAASAASIPTLGGMAAGLYGAAAGAWALLAPFWPILAIGGALIGLWAAWETNLFGVKDAVDTVVGSISGFVGWLSNLAGWAGGGVLDALGAGFHAVMNPIDTIKSGIRWLLNKIPSLPGPKDIPLLGEALSFAGDLLGGGEKKGKKKGENIANGVAKGAKNNKGKVGKATGKVAGEADKRLPSSDAKKGPLSNLSMMGGALPETLAKGVRANKSPVQSEMVSIASAMQRLLPDSLTPPAIANMNAPAPAQTPTPKAPSGRPQAPATKQPAPAQAPPAKPPKPTQTPAAKQPPAAPAPATKQPVPAQTPAPKAPSGRPQAPAAKQPAPAQAPAAKPPKPTQTPAPKAPTGRPQAPAAKQPAPAQTPTPKAPAGQPQPTVNAETGRTPTQSDLTPNKTPTTDVRAKADTQAVSAQMGQLQPKAKMSVQSPDGDVAPQPDVMPNVSHVTDALMNAGSFLSNQLASGGKTLANRVGGLSVPGSDATIAETAAAAEQSGAVPDTLRNGASGIISHLTGGSDTEQPAGRPTPQPGIAAVADPAKAKVEQPGTVGVDTPETLPVGQPQRERPTPPGGFSEMGPATPEQQPSGQPGPRGPPGPTPRSEASGPSPRAAGGAERAVAGGGGGTRVSGGGEPQQPVTGQPQPVTATPKAAPGEGGTGTMPSPDGDTLPSPDAPKAPNAPTAPDTPPAPNAPDAPNAPSAPGAPAAPDSPSATETDTPTGRAPGTQPGQQRGGGGPKVVIQSVSFGDVQVTAPENASAGDIAGKIRKSRRRDISDLRDEISEEVRLALGEGGAVSGDE